MESAHKGATTTSVDLAGRTLVPGFVDGHAHFLGFGSQAVGANLVLNHPGSNGQGVFTDNPNSSTKQRRARCPMLGGVSLANTTREVAAAIRRYDGKRFNRTAATVPLVKYSAPAEGAEGSVVIRQLEPVDAWLRQIEALRRAS